MRAQHCCWAGPLTAVGTGVPRWAGWGDPDDPLGQRSPPGHPQLLPCPVFPAAGDGGGLAGGHWVPTGAQRGAAEPWSPASPQLRAAMCQLCLCPQRCPLQRFHSATWLPPPRAGDTELTGLFAAFSEAAAPRGGKNTPEALPTPMPGCLRARRGSRDTGAVLSSRVTLPGSFSGHIRRCRSRELSRELISVA